MIQLLRDDNTLIVIDVFFDDPTSNFQLREIRNNIDYKGFFVKKEFFDKNKLEYEHIIKLLKKILK